MGIVNLRLPESLHATVRHIAEEEGVSLNQFILLALAEKVSALKTEAYLGARAKRGDREKFLNAMAKVADVPPVEEQDQLT